MEPDRSRETRVAPVSGATSPYGSTTTTTTTTKHYKRSQRSNKYQSGGRDKPLFAARNPQMQTQSAYEEPRFITDSLNTSFAPSPSPARQPYGSAIPRPALANGRARGGWNGGGSPKNNHKGGARGKRSESLVPNSPTPSEKPGSISLHAPNDRSALGRSPSPAKVTSLGGDNQKQTTTPSPPPRGRGHQYSLISPISNASDASPPRELNESYRRIKDEEVLAEQQGSGSEGEPMDDGEYDGFINSNNVEALRDIVNGGVPEHLRSPTPGSRRSSRRFSPAVVAEMSVQDIVLPSVEDKENTGAASGRSSPFDEITQEELEAQETASPARRSSRRSSSSNTSNPKEDRAKLQDLINGPPLFSKARPLRSTLFADDAKNEVEGAGSGRSSGDSRSVSSKGSNLSQGSQKGPVVWGRKARRVGPWLDRIGETAPQPPLTVDFNEQHQHAQAAVKKEQSFGEAKGENKVKMGEIADWVDNSHAEINNTHGSDSFQPDDTDDLAIAGKQLSSAMSKLQDEIPTKDLKGQPTRVQPRVAERDAPKEHEDDLAVNNIKTSARLGEEYTVRKSEEVPSGTDEQAVKVEKSRPTSLFGLLRSGAIFSQKNPLEPPLQASQVTGKPETLTQVKPSFSESSDKAEVPTTKSEVRSSEDSRIRREDSRDILRALARAESKSPSPASLRRNRSSGDEERPSSGLKQERSQDSLLRNKGSIEKPLKPLLQPHEPSGPSTVNESPQVTISKDYAKTPKITGGWIDTPATRRTAAADKQELANQLVELQQSLRNVTAGPEGKAAKVAEQLPKTVEELAATAPKLKTALEEILEKAKVDKSRRDRGEDVESTVLIDDSTLQSLEELLGTPETTSRVATESEESEEDLLPAHSSNAISKPHSQPSETADIGPASKAYGNLVSRLTHLGAHISDSRESMTALQRKVSKYTNDKSKGLAPAQSTDTELCDEAGELHDFILVCPKCGSGGDPTLLQRETSEKPFIDWQPVKFPVPNLWEASKVDGRSRITRRGLVLLAIVFVLFVSFVVDNANSPPFYAAKMEGFGVDYHRPRPPFVMFKLAWRNLLAPLILPAWFSFCVFMRFIAAVCGFNPGVFGHGDEVRPPVIRTPVVDMGFGADEVL